MIMHDIIIIGGGVSGITAAASAARAGRDVLLLEAGDRLGGCIHTWHPTDDFWLELGAHTAYNSYGALLALNRVPGFGNLIPRAKVGYHFVDGSRLQSPFARLSFLDAALHLPFNLGLKKTGLDVQTYFTRLLGPGNWRNLLAPAFAAVLSQPAGPYPAEWLFKRKQRDKAAPRKFTHGDGLQGWMAELAETGGVHIEYDSPVERLTLEASGVRVQLAGTELQARQVLIATPLDVAARLLNDVVPELAERLGKIPMADIETRAAVIAAGKLKLPPVAGLIGADDAFFSAVSRDYLPHPHWRGFAFHFKPGLLSEGAQRQRMTDVLGCKVDDFEFETAKVNRLPTLTPAAIVLAAELEAALAATPVRLAGNYLNGLSLGDAAQYAADHTRQGA